MGLNFTPESFVPGEAPSAGKLNGLMRDPWVAVQAPWEPYTPTLTAAGGGFALGNGVSAGRFHRIGKTVFFEWRFVFGSSTNFGSGVYNITLPLPVSSATSVWTAMGQGGIVDNNESLRRGWTLLWSGGLNSTLVNGDGNRISPTVPMTMVNGDTLTGTGVYETT